MLDKAAWAITGKVIGTIGSQDSIIKFARFRFQILDLHFKIGRVIAKCEHFILDIIQIALCLSLILIHFIAKLVKMT